MAVFLRRSSEVCRQILLRTTKHRQRTLERQGYVSCFREETISSQIKEVRRYCDAIPQTKIHRHWSQRRSASALELRYSENKLGSMKSARLLNDTVNAIIKRDGKCNKLQAYLIIRNCGEKLIYNNPESRTVLAHDLWDKLLKSGVEADVSMYNALLTVYLQNKHDFDPLEMLTTIKNHGLEPNSITLSLLVKTFGIQGEIQGVFKLLEYMKDKNISITESVYEGLIMAYFKSGDIESAKAVLHVMRENGIQPGLESYSTLLKLYAEDGNLDAINETLSVMEEKNIHINNDIYLDLIKVLSEHGKTDEIAKMLEDPSLRSLFETELKTMMISVACLGYVDAALVLSEYVSEHIKTKPLQLLIITVMNARLPSDVILKLAETIYSKGMMKDIYEVILDLSYDCKNTELSTELIKAMAKKSRPIKTHYFYPILACQQQNNHFNGAQCTIELMRSLFVQVDVFCKDYITNSFGIKRNINVIINKLEGEQISEIVLGELAKSAMEKRDLEQFDDILKYSKEHNIISKKKMFAKAFRIAMKNRFLKRPFVVEDVVEILKIFKNNDFYTTSPELAEELYFLIKGLKPVSSVASMGLNFIETLHNEDLSGLVTSGLCAAIMGCLNEHILHNDFEKLIEFMKARGIEINQEHYREMIQLFAYKGEQRAAQLYFCLLEEIEKPDNTLYSELIIAYGNNDKTGYFTTMDGLKRSTAKRIVQIYEDMKQANFKPIFRRAQSYIIISYLKMGDIEEAFKLKQRFHSNKPLNQVEQLGFMKAFAVKGDERNALEMLKEIASSKLNQLMAAHYNHGLQAVNKSSGNIGTQRELLTDMEQKGISPDHYTYDELIVPYLKKNDLNGSFQIFEEAKSHNKFLSPYGCLQLADLCGKLAPEKLKELIKELVHGLSDFSQKEKFILQGLAFACVNCGQNKLADSLMKEGSKDEKHNVYGKAVAFLYAESGDFEAILKCMKYLKDRNLSYATMLVPLIIAYDKNGNYEGVKQAYNSFVSDGNRPWTGLKNKVARVLEKYGQDVPFVLPDNYKEKD